MSLFCSTELAARIERAECRLLKDAAQAVQRSGTATPYLREISGGLAAFTMPGAPFNKIAGLGFDGDLDMDALAEIEREYASRDHPLTAEVSTLALSSIGETLTSRGYKLVGYETVLGKSLKEIATATKPAGLTIDPIQENELQIWIDVVVDGFMTPDTQGLASHEEFPRDVLEQAIRSMTSMDGLQMYLARLNEKPAAGASMRTTDGVAQLCGSATSPAFRRRGIQTAFLAHRLNEAVSAGCDLATVVTQPGSKSQEKRHETRIRPTLSKSRTSKDFLMVPGSDLAKSSRFSESTPHNTTINSQPGHRSPAAHLTATDPSHLAP